MISLRRVIFNNQNSKNNILFYFLHATLFIVISSLFYLAFPEFLIQNHDAQNGYYTIIKRGEWRRSFFEIYTYSPLSGSLGSTFWPYEFLLIPILSIFEFITSVGLRVLVLQIGVATTIFSALLFFFNSFSMPRNEVVGSSWLGTFF